MVWHPGVTIGHGRFFKSSDNGRILIRSKTLDRNFSRTAVIRGISKVDIILDSFVHGQNILPVPASIASCGPSSEVLGKPTERNHPVHSRAATTHLAPCVREVTSRRDLGDVVPIVIFNRNCTGIQKITRSFFNRGKVRTSLNKQHFGVCIFS